MNQTTKLKSISFDYEVSTSLMMMPSPTKISVTASVMDIGPIAGKVCYIEFDKVPAIDTVNITSAGWQIIKRECEDIASQLINQELKNINYAN